MKNLIASITLSLFMAANEPVVGEYSFVDRVREEINSVDTKSIPTDYLLSMAILETGYGTGSLYKRTNNLFSLTVDCTKTGVLHTANHCYRRYIRSSLSVEDVVQVLNQLPTYGICIKKETLKSPHKFFFALQRAGYAEDPHYAQKLERVYKGLQK